MDIIKWCNENQGFLMVILTACYVLATIIIVCYNKKTIKEIQLTRHLAERPYVISYLVYDPEFSELSLIVKNYGKNMAKINEYDIDPSFDLINMHNKTFLHNTLIAPKQSMNFLLATEERMKIFKDTAPPQYIIRINYTDITTQKNFIESSALNIEHLMYMSNSEKNKGELTSSENSLILIRKALKKISNNYL